MDFKFTILDAGRFQGKTLTCNDGKISKRYADPARDWMPNLVTVQTLDDLHDQLSRWKPGTILTTGTPSHKKKGKIRRTKENLTFNGHGLIAIDIDEILELCGQNGHPRLKTLADCVNALRSLHTSLENVGIVATTSSSSFVNGGPLKGAHLYALTTDTTQTPEVLDALHTIATAKGWGRHTVSGAGILLHRSIIDTALKTPCQPIFEGKPKEGSGVKVERLVEIFPGEPLIPEEITTDEDVRSSAKMVWDKWKSDPEILSEITQKKSDAIARYVAKGMNKDEAISHVESMARGKTDLVKNVPVLLDSGQWVTVEEILESPERYHGLTCHDPSDPDYGSGRAIIYSKQRTPIIHSFAHGEKTYFLRCSDETASLVKNWLKKQNDSRPFIIKSPEIHRIVDQTTPNFPRIAKVGNLYKRGDTLVRVEDTDGSWAVAPVRPQTLRVEIAREIAFVGITKNSKVYMAEYPQDAANYLVDRGEWKSYTQSLELVSQGPFIKGTEIYTATGLHYLESGRVALVCNGTTKVMPKEQNKKFQSCLANGKTSREHAREAYLELAQLIEDFPFEDRSEGVSVFLSMLLTMLAAPGFSDPVPAHLVQANERGAGKTLLIKLVNVIATGLEPSPTSYTQDQTEMAKKLFAFARSGHEVVFFDNLKNQFGGQAIESTITTGAIKDRILGISEDATLPFRPIIMATANGARWSEDMARRTIHLRIRAGANPERRRNFRISNIIQHAKENRVKYLSAAFTILKGWAESEDMVETCHIGSFESWARVVRDAIVWAGGVDVSFTQVAIESTDLQDAQAIVKAIKKHYPDGVTAMGLEETGEEEIKAILKERDLLKASTIGKWLSAEVCGRIFNGLELEKRRTKTTRFYMVSGK